MTEIVYAKRIVDFKNIKHPERIIEKRDLTVGIYEERFAEVSEEGGYIVLDFGKEMCGGARILTGWISNKEKFAEIRIRFGESLSEVYSELGEKNSTNDHAPRDFRYLICGLSDLKIGDTGYRFIRIDFPEGVKIPIKTIAGTNTILKMPVRYKYNGADKRIKEIFDAAKRTVDLCSGSGWVWDGIKRDRLVWIGDLTLKFYLSRRCTAELRRLKTRLTSRGADRDIMASGPARLRATRFGGFVAFPNTATSRALMLLQRNKYLTLTRS